MELKTEANVIDHISELEFLVYAVPFAKIPGGFHVKDDPACDTAYHDPTKGKIVFTKALAGMIARLSKSSETKSDMCRAVIIHEAKHAALTRYWPEMRQGPINMVINHLEDWRINRTAVSELPYFRTAAEELNVALANWRKEKSEGENEGKPQKELSGFSEGKIFIDFIADHWAAALNAPRFSADISYAFARMPEGDAKEAVAECLPHMLAAYDSIPSHGFDGAGVVRASLEATKAYHAIIEITDRVLFHKRFEELEKALKKAGYTSPEEIADRLKGHTQDSKPKQSGGQQSPKSQQGEEKGKEQGQQGEGKGQQGEGQGQQGEGKGQQGEGQGQQGEGQGQQGEGQGQQGEGQGQQGKGQGQQGEGQGQQGEGQGEGEGQGQQGEGQGEGEGQGTKDAKKGKRGKKTGAPDPASAKGDPAEEKNIDDIASSIPPDLLDEYLKQKKNGQGRAPGAAKSVTEKEVDDLLDELACRGTGDFPESEVSIKPAPSVKEDAAREWMTLHEDTFRRAERLMANAMKGDNLHHVPVTKPNKFVGSLNIGAVAKWKQNRGVPDPFYKKQEKLGREGGRRVFAAKRIMIAIDGSDSMQQCGALESAKVFVGAVGYAAYRNKIPLISAITKQTGGEDIVHVLSENADTLVGHIDHMKKLLAMRTSGGRNLACTSVAQILGLSAKLGALDAPEQARLINITDCLVSPGDMEMAAKATACMAVPSLVVCLNNDSDAQTQAVFDAYAGLSKSGRFPNSMILLPSFDKNEPEALDAALVSICEWMRDPYTFARMHPKPYLPSKDMDSLSGKNPGGHAHTPGRTKGI